MSSHATEGARPSAAPAGEEPTAEGFSAAPAVADLFGTDPVGEDPFGEDPVAAAPIEDAAAEAEFMEVEFTGADFTDPEYTDPEYTETDSEPVSKLAIVALVTGLVALVPIAIASGVASLIGIRRTGRRGHGMAMAGLFLSAAWVIIAAAIGTVGVLTHGFHKPVTIKYREAAAFTLHEGDCIDGPNAQVVSVLPCSTPHDAEVFATFALPGSRWPGTTVITSEASSGCVSRLDSYLNPQLSISVSQSYVYPNQVAWTAGTRTVICEVRASSGQLTGSVRGGS